MHEVPHCDILLFVTTSTEEEQLRLVCQDLEVPCTEVTSQLGLYYDLGTLGSNRVLAVKTRMGTHRYGGAA